MEDTLSTYNKYSPPSDDTDNNDVDVDFQRNPNAINASPWLFWGTTVFCLIAVCSVFGVPKVLTRLKACNKRRVFRVDRETRKILRLVIPYTIEIAVVEMFSLLVLIMIAQWVNNKTNDVDDDGDRRTSSSTPEVAAYAMVHMLIDFTDELIGVPSDASAILCERTFGAKQYQKSGQYAQITILLYILLSIPVLSFWYFYMHNVIVWLGWDSTETETIAALAQSYTRAYLGCLLFSGITDAITHLWDMQDHADAIAVLEIADGAITVLILAIMFQWYPYPTLEMVGWVCTILSFVTLMIVLIVSRYNGYLRKFEQGLLLGSGFAPFFIPSSSVKTMIAIALPVGGQSLLEQVEWTVLTVLASFIGPAEVAAWAILGNIWDLFYSISEGIGEAAELRVSIHLGNNSPDAAQRSTYKCLVIGMVLSFMTSIVFFSLQKVLPSWFTSDKVLQQLLEELVPYIGVANVTMALGMNCWYIIGAQGRYALATGTFALGSWLVCLPLATILIIYTHFDLQGLASSVVIGSILSGSFLCYFTMTADWDAIALKISTEEEEEEESGSSSDSEDDEETKLVRVGKENCNTFDTIDSEELHGNEAAMSKDESTPLVIDGNAISRSYT